MKKLVISTIFALSSLTALSQDLMQCLNPDVVNGLLFRGRDASQYTLMPGLPPGTVEYALPAEFTLIGTATRVVGGSTTVAYKTGMDVGEAYADLVEYFGDEGWVVESPVDPTPPVFELSVPASGTICRDDERLFLNVREVAGARYASVRSMTSNPPRACRDENLLLVNDSSMRGDAWEFMPSLFMPQSARPEDGVMLREGSGGGTGSADASVRIVSTDSPSSLADDLASQMSQQGWIRETSWDGRFSTGVSLNQQTDDGTVLAAIEIVDLGDSVYNVQVRVQKDW